MTSLFIYLVNRCTLTRYVLFYSIQWTTLYRGMFLLMPPAFERKALLSIDADLRTDAASELRTDQICK